RRTARRARRASDPDRAPVRGDPQGHPAGPADRPGSRDSMSAARYAVALTLLAGALAGCGDDIPDYQSIWTTTHTSAAPTSQEPVPIHQYLESVGVVGRPVPPDEVRDFTITLPTPPGWQPYHNPNFAPG